MNEDNFDAIAVVTLIEANWDEFVSYCEGDLARAEASLQRMREEAGMTTK
jgi:hypothetical protein